MFRSLSLGVLVAGIVSAVGEHDHAAAGIVKLSRPPPVASSADRSASDTTSPSAVRGPLSSLFRSKTTTLRHPWSGSAVFRQ